MTGLDSNRDHLALLIKNFFFLKASSRRQEEVPLLNPHVEFSWQL